MVEMSRKETLAAMKEIQSDVAEYVVEYTNTFKQCKTLEDYTTIYRAIGATIDYFWDEISVLDLSVEEEDDLYARVEVLERMQEKAGERMHELGFNKEAN